MPAINQVIEAEAFSKAWAESAQTDLNETLASPPPRQRKTRRKRRNKDSADESSPSEESDLIKTAFHGFGSFCVRCAENDVHTPTCINRHTGVMLCTACTRKFDDPNMTGAHYRPGRAGISNRLTTLTMGRNCSQANQRRSSG